MKAFLMHRDCDFDMNRPAPVNEAALVQDLELDTLFNAMALDDKFLFGVAKSAILAGTDGDLDTIRYRQSVLKDCLKNRALVRVIYDLTVDSIEKEKKSYFGYFTKSPSAILHRSIQVLQFFTTALERLRGIADASIDQFESEGFTALFKMLQRELDDTYIARIHGHLNELKFHYGILISAELGQGNKGANYVLRTPPPRERSWLQRFFAPGPPSYVFHIHPRDESGARALAELNDRGINLVANALAQSTDHILSFFAMLRTELAFYVGCVNLYAKLTDIGAPASFPNASIQDHPKHTFAGLYDICLALSMHGRVTGNDASADSKSLVIITGANQGGKSTFLRSIGLSQLMMQSGMFVAADSFSSNLCRGLFTHYKREEDAKMESGKLDEELGRISEIISMVGPDSMILFNESFAATNEREGSEIATQIVSALIEKRVKVFFVTHLYQFAHNYFEGRCKSILFLRAERQANAKRTYRLVEGEPLKTSYGEDIYNNIFREAHSTQTLDRAEVQSERESSRLAG
jgi:hypothetical protein